MYEESLEDHVQRARAARIAGRWSDAEASWKAALAAAIQSRVTDAKRAEILGELGLCELQLTKYRDAAEHLSQSLRHRSTLGPSLQRRAVDGWKKAIQRVGTLYLAVDPPDAQVSVDGRSIGTPAPTYELFLEPGLHTVRVHLPGHTDAENTLEVVAGSEHRMGLRLPQGPSTPVLKKSEEKKPPPAELTHQKPASQSAHIANTLRTLGFVAAGTGAAVGGVLTASAAVIDDNLQEDAAGLNSAGACRAAPSSGPCKDLQNAVATRDLVHGVGLGALIASGVIAGVTVSSFWWAPAERSPSRVHVLPTVESEQAGLLMTGVW